MRRSCLAALVLSMLLVAGNAPAAVRTLVLGGGHLSWSEQGKITRFEEVSGAIQAKEFKPYQNIVQMLDKRGTATSSGFQRNSNANILWYPQGAWQNWYEDYDYVLEEDPWSSTAEILPTFLDGNLSTGAANYAETRTYFGSTYRFDIGLVAPIDRFVFYPQQVGEMPGTGLPFTEFYHRGYLISAASKRPPDPEILTMTYRVDGSPEPLPIILREEPHNYEHIIVVDFPLQNLRFFHHTNLAQRGYTLGEIELYGQGYAPEAWYTSNIIPLNTPMNMGALHWDIRKFRWQKNWRWTGPAHSLDLREQTRAVPEMWEVIGGDPAPVEWPNAPVSISVEVRTGTDDSPKVYHKIGELGDEIVVTKVEYLKAERSRFTYTESSPELPEMRGSVTYDQDNWTPWLPVASSGQKFSAPGPRSYIQFRVKVKSNNPWAYGRLDSLWVEYSPPLAQKVEGEVCVEGNLTPEDGIAEVTAALPVTFLYALKATINSSQQGGFNAVRLAVPSKTEFKGLWMGEPLQPVTPTQVVEGKDRLEVYLPGKVTRTNNEPVRIALKSTILAYGIQLSGEVWDTASNDLPQQISAGNAADDINTNQLQVLVREATLEHLTGVEIAPNVITPNDDGINDSAQITYTLALVAGFAQAKIGIYDVSGQQVRILVNRRQEMIYAQQDQWDGKDDNGELVSPGVYLCRIQVRTDTGNFEEIRPITVIY